MNVKAPFGEILALQSTAKREHKDGTCWSPSPKRTPAGPRYVLN